MLERTRVPERAVVLFFAALLVFFLIANRGAYKGYFFDDSLDNLALNRDLPASEYWKGLTLPVYYEHNFRAAGHLFFRWMGRLAGLRFQPYVAFLQALHLVNVWLVYLLLRKLAFDRLHACAGALVYSFHMAVFDVYWEPMYVFDLLCAFFCLLSLLAYIGNRWILSFIAFWLAYRSKEVALMLPVALAAYEFLLAERRWKRLVPFFLVSLWFGLRSMLHSRLAPITDYTLYFDPASVWACLRFYASKVFLIPYAGFAILLLWLIRDRRALFGMASFCVLLSPMLVLPGRLYAAYLYTPLIGLAIAFAVLASRVGPIWIAAFFAIWLPWNYVNLRWNRHAELAQADWNRSYVRGLEALTRDNPQLTTFLHAGGPLRPYGAEGALRLLRPGAKLQFGVLDDPASRALLKSPELAILNFFWPKSELEPLIRKPDTPDASYIEMRDETPVWQLDDGWHRRENWFRRVDSIAKAHLLRPANAMQFELIVNADRPGSAVEVLLNGVSVGSRNFTAQGWSSARWDLASAPAGPAQVTFRVSPDDPQHQLGVAGFGFLPLERGR